VSQFNRCVFCAPRADLVEAETDDFIVLREPYPLVPHGHRMIISREHYGCAGELEPALLPQLEALARRVIDDTVAAHGQASCYEHGRAGACHAHDPQDPSAPVCHHFHLHVLPIELDIHGQLAQRLESWPVAGAEDILDLFYRYGDYLYFRNAQGEARFYTAIGGWTVPPHYMRSLISEGLGKPELADWEQLARAREPAGGLSR